MSRLFRGKAVGSGDAPLPIDAEQIRRALSVFFQPEDTVQLQAAPHWKAERFRALDAAEICAAVERMNADGAHGVYWLTNPIGPTSKPATSEDVLCRRWLMIDFDRSKAVKAIVVENRKAGNYMATDEEKAAVCAVVGPVREYLTAHGWPAPVIVDSGNGQHLYYRIELPNDEPSHEALAAFLKALAGRFNSEAVELDKGLASAKQNTKVPGTPVRKGGHQFPGRPFRRCELLSVPDLLVVVSRELIEATTNDLKPAPEPPPRQNPFQGQAASGEGADKMTRARAYLKKIPGAVSGQEGHKATFIAALKVVRGFDLSDAEALEVLAEWNATCDPPWSEKELRHKVAEAQKAKGERGRLLKESREQDTQRNGAPAGADRGQAATKYYAILDDEAIELPSEAPVIGPAEPRSKTVSVQLFSLSHLLGKEFAPVNWVVPGILSEGLNILAGKPKQGKSMCALNLSITIAAGGMALKSIRTTPGDVLYLSLEDKQRRVQYRAQGMLRGLDVQASKRLQIAVNWPRQHLGGLKYLKWWAGRVERPSLIIIDVWSRFKPPQLARGNAYEQDYEAMNEVKELVDEIGCSALILHHCRKGAKGDVEDVLEEISGTLGLSGAADGILVLRRTRGDTEATLHVIGRDVDDHQLALEFERDTMTWKSLGDANSHLEGKLQISIVQYLGSLNGGSAFVSEISERVSSEPGSVRRILHRLFEKRLVRRVGKAWAVPGEDDPAGTPDFGSNGRF